MKWYYVLHFGTVSLVRERNWYENDTWTCFFNYYDNTSDIWSVGWPFPLDLIIYWIFVLLLNYNQLCNYLFWIVILVRNSFLLQWRWKSYHRSLQWHGTSYNRVHLNCMEFELNVWQRKSKIIICNNQRLKNSTGDFGWCAQSSCWQQKYAATWQIVLVVYMRYFLFFSSILFVYFFFSF